MCSQPHELHMLCPQCDLLVKLPALQYEQKARCPRCKTTLTTCREEPRKSPVSYALSALFMLVLANLFPFVNMNVKGFTSEITLRQIPQILVGDNYVSMASLFMIVVQIIPVFCMLAIVLIFLPVKLPRKGNICIARFLFHLKTWCMVEIFLTGVLVSFVKLIAYGDVGMGTSFIPFVLFCLLQVRAFQCVDRFWVWNQIAPEPIITRSFKIGQSGLSQRLRSCACCMAILPDEQFVCPRCRSRGYARKKYSIQWTMALLITSLMLYIPANMLPIMITQALGTTFSSTIMAGVIMLWSDGSYPIALVIFIASIMVPSLKMLAIAWLCWDTGSSKKFDRERLHVIYEVVEFVGRWSMIDVFVIAVLSALVRMGKLMSIYPADGALLFASVVILTMFAAETFDPRLIWDRSYSLKNEEKPNGRQ